MKYDKLGELQRGVVKHKNIINGDSGSKYTVAILCDNKLYAKSNKKPVQYIPIKITEEDLAKVKFIYSNGVTNDKHEAWTIKSINKISSRADITLKYWSIVKPKMRIKGDIIDGYFHLDLDYVNIISKATYINSIKRYQDVDRKDKKL